MIRVLGLAESADCACTAPCSASAEAPAQAARRAIAAAELQVARAQGCAMVVGAVTMMHSSAGFVTQLRIALYQVPGLLRQRIRDSV
ncbi:hypothetical protein GCM10007417_08230 [Glycocaulis alkaliphilus]|nr:hypothetical protein GCM10007417_08230 [Glycocaulis alkaliphilus]